MSAWDTLIIAMDKDHEAGLRRKLSLLHTVLPSRFWLSVVGCFCLLILPIAILPDPYKYYYAFALLGGWLAFMAVYFVRLGLVAERLRKEAEGGANE